MRLRARRIRHRLTGLLAAIFAVCAGLVGGTCREDGPELPDEHTTLTVPGPHPRGLEVFLGERSVLGFENDRIPELLSRADALVHPDSVGAIYAELSSIVREDLPYTYLTLNVMTYIAHKRVKGLSSPFHANPAWNAEHLWIEDEE